MNVNRGLLFWGLALVVAGATVLAVQQRVIDPVLLEDLWRLWPVVLIAIGLSIILSRTPFAVIGTVLAAGFLGIAVGALFTVGPGFVGCGGDPGNPSNQTGEFAAGTATVELDFNCGDLEVALTDGSGWAAATAVAGGDAVRLSETDGSLAISSPENRGFGEGRQRWEIDLGSEPSYALHVDVNAAGTRLDLAGGTFSELSIEPNAGSLHLDLSGTDVADLDLDLNAGSADITTDAESHLVGSIGLNAGAIDMCTAPDAAIRLVLDGNITFGHNLDESGLNRSGGEDDEDETWTSEGFDGAERFIDLRVEGNAASFDLNPEGGCE